MDASAVTSRGPPGWDRIKIPGWTNDRYFTFPRNNWYGAGLNHFATFSPGEIDLRVQWAGYTASKRMNESLQSKTCELARKIDHIDFYYAVFDKVAEMCVSFQGLGANAVATTTWGRYD